MLYKIRRCGIIVNEITIHQRRKKRRLKLLFVIVRPSSMNKTQNGEQFIKNPIMTKCQTIKTKQNKTTRFMFKIKTITNIIFRNKQPHYVKGSWLCTEINSGCQTLSTVFIYYDLMIYYHHLGVSYTMHGYSKHLCFLSPCIDRLSRTPLFANSVMDVIQLYIWSGLPTC